jgi:hypothetical protein
MRARYARDLQPADDVEETLVDEVCFNYWRLQEAREAEVGIIDKHSTALQLIALISATAPAMSAPSTKLSTKFRSASATVVSRTLRLRKIQVRQFVPQNHFRPRKSPKPPLILKTGSKPISSKTGSAPTAVITHRDAECTRQPARPVRFAKPRRPPTTPARESEKGCLNLRGRAQCKKSNTG